MIKDITVEAAPRESRGKNAARRLRREGHIPAVLYGGGKEAVPVRVNAKQIGQILHSATGHNTIFQVKVDGAPEAAMLVDWQFDPLRGDARFAAIVRAAEERHGRAEALYAGRWAEVLKTAEKGAAS